MPLPEPQSTSSGPTDGVPSVWERIRACLEDRKHRIYEEIRQYPRPIPACDQQFNYLLEERMGIVQELDRMEEAFQESLAGGDPGGRIDEFLRSSVYIDEATGREIRASLAARLSR